MALTHWPVQSRCQQTRAVPPPAGHAHLKKKSAAVTLESIRAPGVRVHPCSCQLSVVSPSVSHDAANPLMWLTHIQGAQSHGDFQHKRHNGPLQSSGFFFSFSLSSSAWSHQHVDHNDRSEPRQARLSRAGAGRKTVQFSSPSPPRPAQWPAWTVCCLIADTDCVCSVGRGGGWPGERRWQGRPFSPLTVRSSSFANGHGTKGEGENCKSFVLIKCSSWKRYNAVKSPLWD